jgi:hypothetical protein
MPVLKKTYSVFQHTLLLAVYAVFFSVQFFFNFESLAHTETIPAYGIFSHTPSGHARFTEKKPNQSASKNTIRLNKRFQQEEMPPCEMISVPAPVQYITLRSLGYYENVLRLFIFPVSQPFRGPPVAAC